jgi:tRNA U34 5-methylaminomethyl-2-thiouridine-forming methyltransferase MnmC
MAKARAHEVRMLVGTYFLFLEERLGVVRSWSLALFKEEFELVTLKSGVQSLRMLSNREIFHPGIGPKAEANILYVDQQRLVERCHEASEFVIWDVGLGAGANACAAISALQSNLKTQIRMISFDRTIEPLRFALSNAQALEYPSEHLQKIQSLVDQGTSQIRPGFDWELRLGDFTETMLSPALPLPDAIFYDPYSPNSNTDMWRLDHFTKLFQRLGTQKPYLWTNYTRSTVVRVTLLLAGFYVGSGSTIGEKEETTVASNDLSLIAHPLKKSWLTRVKISHSSSPIRGASPEIAPISDVDWEKLLEHPQFRD